MYAINVAEQLKFVLPDSTTVAKEVLELMTLTHESLLVPLTVE